MEVSWRTQCYVPESDRIKIFVQPLSIGTPALGCAVFSNRGHSRVECVLLNPASAHTLTFTVYICIRKRQVSTFFTNKPKLQASTHLPAFISRLLFHYNCQDRDLCVCSCLRLKAPVLSLQAIVVLERMPHKATQQQPRASTRRKKNRKLLFDRRKCPEKSTKVFIFHAFMHLCLGVFRPLMFILLRDLSGHLLAGPPVTMETSLGSAPQKLLCLRGIVH